MIQCNRCGKWFKESDSRTCDPCWEEMGQMTFWHDDEDDEAEWEDPRIARAESEQPPKVVSVGSEDWEERHPITSVFDREDW